jgi:hypothetical protein
MFIRSSNLKTIRALFTNTKHFLTRWKAPPKILVARYEHNRPQGHWRRRMTNVVKTDGIFNLTLPVVMSFPHLFEAKAYTPPGGKATGEPKFSANLNFAADSEDLKSLKQLAAKIARAQWPDKPFSELHFPFSSGDKLADERKKKGKDDGEYTRGKVVVNAKSKYEVRLAYTEKGKIIDLETDTARLAAKGKFYSGVEVLAQLNLTPYEVSASNKGITAYLNMVLSIGKGERLSGGQTASEAFKDYVGSVSAEDPTAPGTDESLDDVMGA